MEELQIFENAQFGSIRTAGTSDKPLFCLSDICKILGIRAADAKKRLRSDGVDSIYTPTQNQYGAIVKQPLLFISEQNLYKVIMRSDKPQAEAFQDWVCGEVLPTIRKHGAYMSPQTIERTLSDPDFIIGLATKLKEEQTARIKAESERNLALQEKEQMEDELQELATYSDLQEFEIQQRDAKIMEDEPKVRFVDVLSTSNDLMLVSDFAKILAQKGVDIGGNRLFDWFRKNGFLCRKVGFPNSPTQRSIDGGWFKVVQRPFLTKSNEVKMTYTPKLTVKGQVYFADKLIKEFAAQSQPA